MMFAGGSKTIFQNVIGRSRFGSSWLASWIPRMRIHRMINFWIFISVGWIWKRLKIQLGSVLGHLGSTYSLPIGGNFLFEISRYCLNITNLVFAFFKRHPSVSRTYHRRFISWCSRIRCSTLCGIWSSRNKIWTWFFFYCFTTLWVIINDEILWEILLSKNNSLRSVVPLSLFWWLKLSFRGFILKYIFR